MRLPRRLTKSYNIAGTYDVRSSEQLTEVLEVDQKLVENLLGDL